MGFRFRGSCYAIAEVDKELIESANTAKKEGREERSRIKVRMVIIRIVDEKTGKQIGKRLSVVTCNKDRSAWQIAYFMLNRWGKIEKFFKEAMAIFNFDYQPGYAISEMQEQPLFDNPQVRIIKSAIKTIEKEIRRIEGESAILQLEYQKKAKDKVMKKIKQIETQKQEKIEDKRGLEKGLEQLPVKVTLESLLNRPMSHCDLQKKRLYDLMQIITYHARERLLEEFRQCYNRTQDVKQMELF